MLHKRPDMFVDMDDFVVDLNPRHRITSSGASADTLVDRPDLGPAVNLARGRAVAERGPSRPVRVLPAPARAQAS